MTDRPGNTAEDGSGATHVAEPSNIIRRVVGKAAKVLFGSGISKLLLIGVEFFLAAYLGAAGYGLFSIAFALLLVLAALCQVGMGFGIVQYLSIYAEEEDADAQSSVIRVGLLLVFVVSSTVAALIHINSAWLAARLFDQPALGELLQVAAIIIPFEAINLSFSASFRGLRKFRYHVLAQDFIRNAVLFLVVPLSLLSGVNEVVALQILGLGSIAGTGLSLIVLSRDQALFRFFGRDWEIFKELLSFSYMLFLWQALQKTANELMVLIAGAILLPAYVGVFALAIRIVSVLNFPQSVINATAPVEFARFNHRSEIGSITHLLQVTAVLLMAVGMVYAAFIAINSEYIFRIFGPSYAGFGWVLQILLIAKVFDVGSGSLGQALIACRKRRLVLILGAFDVLLQFLVVVPFMGVFGLAGAVFGNAARYVIIVFARHLALFRSVGAYSLSRSLVLLFSVGLASIFSGQYIVRSELISRENGLIISCVVVFIVGFTLIHIFRNDSRLRQLASSLTFIKRIASRKDGA